MKKALAALLVLGLAAPAAGAEWMPVREMNLEIAPGSPLDFSAILPNAPIGEDGRIVAGAGGHLAFARTPDRPQRFFCAAVAWGPPSKRPVDHAFIDRYVRQLKLNGYNLARFHFIDADMMQGRERDFDLDPRELDNIRYFMAALKRAGIYWIVDGLTSESGALGGRDIDRWSVEGDLKRRIYVDEDAFQHWLRFQKLVYATVNPYTGLAPLKDPALALVVPYNENGIEFTSWTHGPDNGEPYWSGYRPAFNAFLRKRYKDTATLARSWGGLAAGENLEEGTVALPRNRRIGGGRMHDFQAFMVEMERALAARLEGALRGLGYRGLVAPYNVGFTIQTALSRQPQGAVTANAYYDWIGSMESGTTMKQRSSIADAADYVTEIAAGRWLGRPFVVTEYDHLFWSHYRYEAGLVAPAYAALQGWDALCRHGNGPLTLAFDEASPSRQRIVPYTIAVDPVARAGEKLTSLLFRRGDVAAAPFATPLMMNGETSLGDEPEAREPKRLKALALTGGIGLFADGLAWPDGLRRGPAITYRDVSAQTVLTQWRGEGLLPAANRTDPLRGVYESATGELLLDRARKSLRAVTPLTEALAFDALSGPAPLGEVTLANADGRGLFAASSLDGHDLASSRRVLIIFATDARNSGMRFRDPEEKVIEDWGRLPVLLLRGRLDVAFAHKAASWRLSPVGLDGKLHAAVASGTGPASFRLDNGAGPDGPTTYFLLERDFQ